MTWEWPEDLWSDDGKDEQLAAQRDVLAEIIERHVPEPVPEVKRAAKTFKPGLYDGVL